MVLLAGPSSLQSKSSKISIRNALLLAAEYLVYLAALCLLSTYVTGNWQWMQNTWGAVYGHSDLTGHVILLKSNTHAPDSRYRISVRILDYGGISLQKCSIISVLSFS
jgi:hypothetical protein